MTESAKRIRVRMPDGQIISAREGVTKAEIGARYKAYLRNERAKGIDASEYDPESPAYKAKYGATTGMSTYDKTAANVGAGATNVWQGLKQAFTFGEEKNKAMDADVAGKRARDDELAGSIKGGRALQVAGEILPTLIPGGAAVKGITSLPRLGTLAARYGIGTRVLPTLVAEGALTGAGTGALSPTTEDESTLANALIGGTLGAGAPGAAAGLAKLGQKYLLGANRAAGRKLAGELGPRAAKAERDLAQYAQRVARGVDEPPSSTAMITQAPEHGERELVARASKLTGGTWGEFDKALNNARWDILDRNLASAKTVAAAMKATNDFADAEVPKFLAAVKPKAFALATRDLRAALQAKLTSDETIADPAARLVYGHMNNQKNLLAKQGHRWTPETLWRERKVLSAWLSGRPPPGMEGVRAPNVDRYILDARNAIDATLNRASGDRWGKFLGEFGERLQAEGQQKAGQNIRNSFIDETLSVPRVPSVDKGIPAITEAQLRKQYIAHGQNEFGRTLDTAQDEAVNTVLENLRAQGVLQGVKKSMTGGGGSMTAPLRERLVQTKGGGDIKAFLDIAMNYASDKEKILMSRAMQDPAFALKLLRSGRAQVTPLTRVALTRISRLSRAAVPAQRAALTGAMEGTEAESEPDLE